MLYYDTSRPEIATAHESMVSHIKEQGLVYPVTVVDGAPLYDGAVSYPAILRAVQKKLEGTN